MWEPIFRIFPILVSSPLVSPPYPGRRHVNFKFYQQIWSALRIQDKNMPAAKIIAVSFSPLKQVTLWIDKKTFYPFCCPLLETMSIYNTVASGNENIEFFEEKARLKF